MDLLSRKRALGADGIRAGVIKTRLSFRLMLLHVEDLGVAREARGIVCRNLVVSTSPLHRWTLGAVYEPAYGPVDILDDNLPDPAIQSNIDSMPGRVSVVISTRIKSLHRRQEAKEEATSLTLRQTPSRLVSLRIDGRLEDILRELTFGDGQGQFAELYKLAKLAELLCCIRSGKRSPKGKLAGGIRLTARDVKILADLRSFLHSEATDNLTLQDLARKFGVNRNKLAHGFKHKYGITVMTYRRRARLLKALEILRDSDMQIGEVAVRAGFEHACNFSTAFKEEFGVSPKCVRESPEVVADVPYRVILGGRQGECGYITSSLGA